MNSNSYTRPEDLETAYGGPENQNVTVPPCSPLDASGVLERARYGFHWNGERRCYGPDLRQRHTEIELYVVQAEEHPNVYTGVDPALVAICMLTRASEHATPYYLTTETFRRPNVEAWLRAVRGETLLAFLEAEHAAETGGGGPGFAGFQKMSAPGSVFGAPMDDSDVPPVPDIDGGNTDATRELWRLLWRTKVKDGEQQKPAILCFGKFVQAASAVKLNGWTGAQFMQGLTQFVDERGGDWAAVIGRSHDGGELVIAAFRQWPDGRCPDDPVRGPACRHRWETVLVPILGGMTPEGTP